MKRVLLSIIVICFQLLSYAQTASGTIALYPYVNAAGFDKEETNYLKTKVEAIVAANGYGSLNYCDRFVLLVKSTLVENSVTTTYPTRISKKYELTFIVGDVIENKTFGSETITLSGIGTSDKKAKKTALSSLKNNNLQLQSLFQKAEVKIREYYASNEQTFIAKAKELALNGNFDEAISYLMSIPPVDDTCTQVCQDYAIELYATMVDKSSFENLQAAKAAWTTDRNTSGARVAISYLKKVDIGSAYYGESLVLWDEIIKKLEQNEIEEKEFALQQYKDEQAFALMQYHDNVAFRSRLVDACETVGVAFCQNRPKTITKLVGLW